MANLDKSGISSGGSITSTHVTNLYDALTGDTTYDNINLKKFNSLGINDDATSTKINITNTGLGIGVSPSTELHVSGNIFATGNITAYYSSDIRLKDNVRPIEDSLFKLSKLRGVEFDWNEKAHELDIQKGHDVGLIAQEVEEVLPEVVVTRDDGFKAVRYDRVVSLLVQGINDQQKQIKDLKSDIIELKKRL
jgi:hypothetical protein|tara:strand:+ start:1836 stop:2414 length:579 start_codon:yes stop_codon:yes gene_type:complete